MGAQRHGSSAGGEPPCRKPGGRGGPAVLWAARAAGAMGAGPRRVNTSSDPAVRGVFGFCWLQPGSHKAGPGGGGCATPLAPAAPQAARAAAGTRAPPAPPAAPPRRPPAPAGAQSARRAGRRAPAQPPRPPRLQQVRPGLPPAARPGLRPRQAGRRRQEEPSAPPPAPPPAQQPGQHLQCDVAELRQGWVPRVRSYKCWQRQSSGWQGASSLRPTAALLETKHQDNTAPRQRHTHQCPGRRPPRRSTLPRPPRPPPRAPPARRARAGAARRAAATPRARRPSGAAGRPRSWVEHEGVGAGRVGYGSERRHAQHSLPSG